MADTVPVRDVLSEAMEYLSKLGSNLRVRSENLKEKRLRKDKLRNSHAVKKIASKVLLICELSKKSIENVETGVKKILTQIVATQESGSDGGKITSHKSSNVDSDIKYEYFNYNSRNLKIRNKVNLKHFTSVKVVAKAMSTELLEKHSVFYNCKLYRKRKNKNIESVTVESSNNISLVEQNKPENSIPVTATVVIPEERKEGEVSDAEIKDKETSTSLVTVAEGEPKLNDKPNISKNEPGKKNKKKKNKHIISHNDSSSIEKEISKSPEEVLSEIQIECETSTKDQSSPKKNTGDDNIPGNLTTSLTEVDNISSINLTDSILSATDVDMGPVEKEKQSNDLSDNSEVSKKSDSNDNSEVSKKSDSNDNSEVSKISDSNDNSEVSKKSDSNDNSEVSKKSDSNDNSEVSKKSDSNDNGEVSKKSDSNDNSKVSKKSDSNDNSEVSKISDSNDNSEVSKKSDSNDNSKVSKKSDSNDNSEVSKISDSNDNSEVSKKSDSNDNSKVSKKSDSNDNSKVSKKSDSNDNSEESKKSDSNDNGEIAKKSDSNDNYTLSKKSDSNDNSEESKKSDSNDNGEIAKKSDSNDNYTLSKKSDSNDEIKENKKVTPCTDNTNTINVFDNHNTNGDNTEKSMSKPNLETNETSQSSSDSKPYIKCVNISKLLKDGIKDDRKDEIHVVESDSDEELSVKRKKNKADTNKKKHKYNHNERKPLKAGKKFKSEKRSKTNDNEEYWKLKRNEIKKFKAKQFSINVTRLPVLSQEYLYKQNLKKIFQNGSILCKCVESSDDGNKKGEIECEESIPTITETATTTSNLKSSLLHYSDSDDNENLKNVAENLNEDLGNDSERNCNLPDTNDNIGNNSLENRSKSKTPDPIKECDQNNEIFKSPQNDQIKKCLLNDSTDENSPNKKGKNEKESSSPPSKRKHIMESMHAKKMLLTYSSSSDTDDEELKGALKQIRDYLLKGNSSDDEKNEDKATKAPSESDASSVCLKRKRSRSRSVSSHNETSKDKKVSESESSSKKTSSQTEDNIDEKSSSSSKKMEPSKSNPGSSTQNTDSQDTYDKEIDGLTNLKSLNKKHRRRDSTSTGTTQRSSRSSRRMPKPCISEEGFLKAESSSDNASVADSEDGYEAEDLPEVSLSGLNGDGIGHLAKDDLLEESNSSSSPNKSSSDDKKTETEEGHGKSKSRRKAAISSDSEAGSSRKKTIGVKMSDFEDSEDDSEPKKNKRKKKGSDSDASAGSSLDESKKKRRRIKNVDDSDGSGSETETEGRNKHGRKNIRKVMSKNQLEEATKKAAREEKERIARISERQKLYNNLEFDESGKPDEVVLDKVVLDFDPETKEPLIEVDKGLVKKLKPHQANGIKFMWNACFESVKRIKKDKGSGCILAHCMGLGKTLQVVSLTHTLLTHSSLTGVNRVLVVCPLSTVLNWVNEFGIWLKHTDNDYDVDVYELSRYKQNSERSYQLSQWFSGGGVCVLGYEMFRNLSSDSNKKLKKKMMKSFQESLVEPGPDLVVCDEGHLLKNEKTSLSQAMNRVRTLRRIVLTGTPLQNNLKEYYCMVQFVKPNLLGKYNEYLNRFVNPITNGQYTDSTEHDIRIMKRRSHVLHKMLDGAVQRRDYGVLAPFLPPKHEYVLFITLTEVQIKLYQHYLDNYSRRPLAGKSSGFLFPDFQSLQRIWTHPLVLKYNSERYEIMQQKKREREEEDSEGSIADFIDDDSTPDESSTEESSDSLSDVSDDSRKKSKKKKSAKKSKGKDSKVTTRRGTRANPVEMADEVVVPLDTRDLKSENPTEWWMSLVSEDELEDMRHSHKLVLLFDILRQCEAIGDKLLVFSQSLYSLDLIEHFLSKVDDATQEGRVDEKLNGHVGTWSPGLDYFRLDGSTSCENRSIWCKNFNREDNPRARLFLISTRAGGLGINLVAANRVVIFDVSWNPSHDVQSIFRVYRFGQKKPCYIYRFLAMGTMEEKIYERQVTKQAISKRVIDEQQIDRHYAENDLAELYKFEPSPPPREIPPLPKDRLFAEMLKEHEKQIYKYHEHDSLLENKEEETLTEEERKAAWEDFENEKTRPPPAPFNYNMHANGMMQGLFAQQYATIAAMLRKETPNITDSQIRDMQTLLYNSNPAALMGEIYKYAQPAMMNQRMMNPGMVNPGGGGMAVGGSSGLQYEPPWQRQQQMRMQQLMQQQNMGAKYYSGGLGSRDPMAMALQQQRARELMLGERSRPRGRPPGRATAAALPPAHTTAPDVVNLDSD